MLKYTQVRDIRDEALSDIRYGGMRYIVIDLCRDLLSLHRKIRRLEKQLPARNKCPLKRKQ